MANPQVTTLNSLLQSLPASLLGMDMSDPSNAMLGQIINNWLKQNIIQPVTGISPTDSIWSATLYTNMTDFGALMNNMNSAANSQGLINMRQMQESARYQFLEGWQRTATTREAFNAMTTEQRGGFSDYEAFIEHKTQGMMDNQILRMLMQAGGFDPTGKLMASDYVRQASANVARDAMWRGERDFQQQAEAVGRIFMGDDLRMDYNKRDYGLMTMNESSAVLAAMTRDRGLMDFAPGARGEINRIKEGMKAGTISEDAGADQITAQMKAATEALRERLKGLTTAMAPLKDFFGDDVPNMIRFLEELSGKSFSELNSDTISNLTRRVSNSLATGIYTADQMRSVTKALNQSVSQMDVPFYLDTVTPTIADTMLSTVNAGITPELMSDQTFRSVVSERTLRHAASPFANSMNLAYSNWKWNRERAAIDAGGTAADADVSFETFRQMYGQLTSGDNRMTAENAMLELSGANSWQEMAKLGYEHSGYTIATREGLGALMADTESLRSRVEIAAATRDTVAEQDAIMGVYNRLTNEEARNGLTAQGMIEQIMGWEHSTNANERNMYAAYKTMSTDKAWMPLMADMSIEAAKVDAGIRTRNAEINRKRTDFIGQLFGDLTNASNRNELIFNMLLGENFKGANIDEQLQKIRGISDMGDLANKAGIDEADIANMQVILQSGKREIQAIGGGFDEKGNPLTQEGKRMQRQYLEIAKEYMTNVAISGKEYGASLTPYLTAAKALNPEDTSADAQLTWKTLGYASSLSKEVLDLFAEEDRSKKQEAGTALRTFIRDKEKDFQEVQKAGKDLRDFNTKWSDPEKRTEKLRQTLGNIVSGKKTVGFSKDLVETLDIVAPEWRSQWQEALATDDRTKDKDKKASTAFINDLWGRVSDYVGRDERAYIRGEITSQSAYQRLQFSETGKALLKREADVSQRLKEDTALGSKFWRTEGGNKSATFGQKVMDLFNEQVVTGKQDMNKFMENFSDLKEDQQKNIRTMFQGLLDDAKQLGIQNTEAVSTVSVEDLMSRALGVGGVLEKLDQSIQGLSNMLTQIPAFIKGAAEKWNIKMEA